MAKIIESQIISGLYGIFDMNGSIFFIKSKKSKLIMIDSGLFYQKNNIKKFLNKYNFSFNDITNILITHGEGDHVGTIPYIKKKNPKVIIHGSSLTDNYMKKRINPPHWFFPVNIFLQTVFLFTFKT